MNLFGESLKQWRKKRSLSQLDLSLSADISSKHISFLENGKSQPSREMVLHLAQVLDVPLAERNILLNHSGFAEAYSRQSLDSDQMKPVHHALSLLLSNHNPYPAMVLDWDWNIIMVNDTQRKISALAQQDHAFPATTNLMELLFHPEGYRPFITNWEEVAFHMLLRLKQERAVFQDRNSDLLQRLLAFPGVPQAWHLATPTANPAPILTIDMELGDIELSLFSTLATFGTPIDITLQELTIEQYFPSNEASQRFLEALAQTE
jgi:transcriptional regulator with XRE-family HTH domain